MIICFEGASAIGKSKMSESFSEDYHIVPEVNLLFQRTASSSKYWYYEKQVERYQLCEKSQLDSILDGDIFQPIWYNWIYQYPPQFLSKKETESFYLEQLRAQQIAFPDLYIIFHTDIEKLRERKKMDQSRKRRNFEKHLTYIRPQRDYFEFLEKHTQVKIEFVAYDNFEIAKAEVASLIQVSTKSVKDPISTFEKLCNWLEGSPVD